MKQPTPTYKDIQREIFPDGKGAFYDFGEQSSWVVSRTRVWYCLNLARPITRWRRLRHWLNWPEGDTMALHEKKGGATRADYIDVTPERREP